ncbi:hypothetical protein PM082_011031 [Marasmius tenuissimus]|nr:hypothetical protein PM082_011031 [Marasmius tenuissimus]
MLIFLRFYCRGDNQHPPPLQRVHIPMFPRLVGLWLNVERAGRRRPLTRLCTHNTVFLRSTAACTTSSGEIGVGRYPNARRVAINQQAGTTIPRNQIILAISPCHSVDSSLTSLDLRRPALRDRKQYTNQRGVSRAAIFNVMDASLKHPKISHIALIQTHDYYHDAPAEATMKALESSRGAGDACNAITVELAYWHSCPPLRVCRNHSIKRINRD